MVLDLAIDGPHLLPEHRAFLEQDHRERRFELFAMQLQSHDLSLVPLNPC